MLRFAVRNLCRKKVRSFLSLAGLAVAIILVIGLISFSTGVKVLIESTLRQVQGLVVVWRAAPDPIISTIPKEFEQKLARLPGVRVVQPEVWTVAITFNGTLLMHKGLDMGGLGVLGMEPKRTLTLQGGGLFNKHLQGGRFLKDGEDDACMISTLVSKKLELPLGSRARFHGAPLKVVGLFKTGSLILDQTVVVTTHRARQMRRLDEKFVSNFYLELEDNSDLDALADKINTDHPELRAMTPETINETVGGVLRKVDRLLLVITVLPILGAALAILNTMLMSFSERIAEFGILKACGWERRDILRLVLLEAVLLGVGGGVLGCVVGGVATELLGLYLSVQPVTPAWLYAASLGLSAVLGMVGGAYPAYRAAIMPPIDAIRHV